MTTAPWLINSAEVARMFRVSRKTLRRWERKGLLARAPESRANYIYYARADVERLLQRGDADA